jgi:hypothetical protein
MNNSINYNVPYSPTENNINNQVRLGKNKKKRIIKGVRFITIEKIK